MDLKKQLLKLGLKNAEAAVYLASLELGVSTAQRIAQKARIKRTYFYDVAKSLEQQGLISEIVKSRKRFFVAASPEKIRDIQNEKIKTLENVLPQLKAIDNTSGQKPKITFFDGIEGIKEVNKDSLKHQGEIFGFTTEKFINAEERKLSREYIEDRVDKGIKARVFGPTSKELIELRKKDKQELRETRMLPKDIFDSNVEFVIYGNKVAITNYRDEFGLIIESDDVAKPLKQLFELIWKGGFIMD